MVEKLTELGEIFGREFGGFVFVYTSVFESAWRLGARETTVAD